MPVSRGQIYNAMAHKSNLYNMIKPYIYDYGRKVLGYDQMKNQQDIAQTTIDYNEYLRKGYERQEADWYKNVDGKFRTIKYPEFSYSGKSRGLAASSTIAGLSADTAYSNFVSGLGYRSMGFYQLGSGLYTVPARSYSKYL